MVQEEADTEVEEVDTDQTGDMDQVEEVDPVVDMVEEVVDMAVAAMAVVVAAEAADMAVADTEAADMVVGKEEGTEVAKEDMAVTMEDIVVVVVVDTRKDIKKVRMPSSLVKDHKFIFLSVPAWFSVH